MIVKLNEERFAIGKGPVGFVNPTLYAHPYVLNDIKNGTNVGCGSEGFAAIPGYVFPLYFISHLIYSQVRH
jgi:tripeptidyl-peptidase-1